MTREELHNEAYEYCERRKDEFIRMINYIEIAEPREKRIEELKKENQQLKQKFEKAKDIIKNLIDTLKVITVKEAEQFLKESE